MMVTEYVNC